MHHERSHHRPDLACLWYSPPLSMRHDLTVRDRKDVAQIPEYPAQLRSVLQSLASGVQQTETQSSPQQREPTAAMAFYPPDLSAYAVHQLKMARLPNAVQDCNSGRRESGAGGNHSDQGSQYGLLNQPAVCLHRQNPSRKQLCQQPEFYRL